MHITKVFGTPIFFAALFTLLPSTSFAADRCAQFNLTLPAEFGGAPTQVVEGGVRNKQGKVILLSSLTCEFTTGKGRVLLDMQKNAKADSVASSGRVLAMSNNGKQPQKLEGVGDEALYSRNSSVMRKGKFLYRVGWKWANNSNANITAAQAKTILAAVLAATPDAGPTF